MESSKKTTTERRCSLLILSMAIAFIVIIVIAGVSVHFLVEGNTGKIVLVILIGVLVLVGLISFAFLECLRRYELRRTEVVVAKSDQRQKVFPTTQQVSGSSWAYSTPWRYSKGSTITAQQ